MIYPAIDIRDGKCVRLTQGDFQQEKVYFQKPAEVAKMWEAKGGKFLHIVDLDGALEGKSKNLPVIQEIVRAVNIPIQVGGGIRSLEAIENLINIGVSRVIVGTKALQDREMVKKAVETYGDKIVVAIDAKKGYVAIDGWTKASDVSALDFAVEMETIGVKTIIYTDIAKDGMLEGPNLEAMEELKNQVNMDIIASGGVSSLEDLNKLVEIGMAGAIVGKALYENRIQLEEVKVGL